MKNHIFSQLTKYAPLTKELISRDLKVKYRRSILGYLWSLLNPLMMMAIMSMVFSRMFRFQIPNFPLYLICGQTLWSFLSESTNAAMYSVIQNSSLIKKVYIPKYIFPLSRVFSSFVTTSFSLVAILIVLAFSKVTVGWTILLFPIPVIFLLFFCMGIGMVLSAVSVYFRDVVHLYGVISLAWMYVTPLFYSLENVPEDVRGLILINPMYYYITFFRNVVINNIVPDLSTWLICVTCSALSMLVGITVFRKLQNNFILYV